MATPDAEPAEAYIMFSGPIHAEGADSIIKAAIDAVDAGARTVVLCMASFGGNLDRGVSAGNMLAAMPAKLVTFNVGICASAANVLFLAGEERFASPEAVFRFHAGSVTLSEEELTGTQLDERRAWLVADDEREQRIIQRRSSLTRAQARRIVEQSETFDAGQALAAGIVQEVKDLKIPAGSLMISA